MFMFFYLFLEPWRHSEILELRMSNVWRGVILFFIVFIKVHILFLDVKEDYFFDLWVTYLFTSSFLIIAYLAILTFKKALKASKNSQKLCFIPPIAPIIFFLMSKKAIDDDDYHYRHYDDYDTISEDCLDDKVNCNRSIRIVIAVLYFVFNAFVAFAMYKIFEQNYVVYESNQQKMISSIFSYERINDKDYVILPGTTSESVVKQVPEKMKVKFTKELEWISCQFGVSYKSNFTFYCEKGKINGSLPEYKEEHYGILVGMVERLANDCPLK